jgi:L-rhamnose isomerase
VSHFPSAVDQYAEFGVDANQAIRIALETPISIHCWQTDDVKGFEVYDGPLDGGGILATGSYPGAAKNIDQVRQDLEKVLSLVPGTHRVNLHAIYADPAGKKIDRADLTFEHFDSWVHWGLSHGVKLDFNPTYFAHPLAADGMTLSHPNQEVRDYWIRHGIACRRIAAGIASAQAGDCVNNHWIPDGMKDSPADRWSPRKRLIESLDLVFADNLPGSYDAVESKLFGLGSEDYVVGSFEFYSLYALTREKLLCLDMGHFHPTEGIADKLSSLLQFHPKLLVHVSRPVRWDSDHVVLFNDDVRAVFLEFVRGQALERAIVALDYFDASINRIAAYVIGIRATRKAILSALLDPSALLAKKEGEGNFASKLALMEEAKTLPFGTVWDELCRRSDKPIGAKWIQDVEEYEASVPSVRA